MARVQNRPRKYRVYTDKFKATVLLMLEAAGGVGHHSAMAQVSKKYGVPYRTLQGWANNGVKQIDLQAKTEIDELMDDTRKELVELFDTEVRSIFGSLEGKREEATYKELAWAAAVFLDKLQLLNNKPTQNVQQAISFIRSGVSTLPEHLTPIAIEGPIREEEV